MSRTRKPLSLVLWTLVIFATSILVMSAQDAVPGEILQRTRFIKFGNEAGTAFSIDYQGKLYLVTAKHVVAGAPKSGAVIQVMKAGKWVDFETIRTLYPPSNDVDIAVFETDAPISKPFGVTVSGAAGAVTMGQQVWFLGYPYGIESRWSNGEAPFIKRGTMSAIDATNPNAVVLYIDGFNNPGFSGGPIVYWDFSKHIYSIIGVVKGYRMDTAKMIVNGKQVDTQLLVNSGILVGYSIQHVIEAIEQETPQQK